MTTQPTQISLAETRARAGLFLEPGAAFAQLEASGLRAHRSGVLEDKPTSERHEVIVIGGGQAGLSTGYHLARKGLSFVILEAADRVGDVWRKRWDSLRLFTAARFCGLDGMRFPSKGTYLPSKDEFADFLESYARKFALPVRTGIEVEAMTREGNRYVVTAGKRRFEAEHVVIAAASYQKPKLPAFATELDPSIRQLHSSAYKNPKQLQDGAVLLVGAGNSGAEIAMDLHATHKIYLAGKNPGEIPFDTSSAFAIRVMCLIIFRGIFHRLLSVDSPLGRKAKPHFVNHSGPLIRVKSRDLVKAGVTCVGRVAGVSNGKPMLEDGRVLDVTNIIWCTGFANGLDWVKLPIFDENGRPKQYRGVVENEAGLYFAGLTFQHAPSSTMIHGVGRDARRVAEKIAGRITAAARDQTPS